MIWGKPFAGKLVYSLGTYEGHNKVAGLSGQNDKLLFAGRLHYNILDPEPAPSAEQLVDWLRWAWQQTDVVRLRLVRSQPTQRELRFG